VVCGNFRKHRGQGIGKESLWKNWVVRGKEKDFTEIPYFSAQIKELRPFNLI